MLCSGFVWVLRLIEGSGQTSFCDETMPYMEGHCGYSALSLLRQREGDFLSPFLSCHTEPWDPGLCRMRAQHQGILVHHKPRALPCLLWGMVTCLLYIFAMKVSELILKYVVLLVEKFFFFRKMLLTWLSLLLEQVWFMVNLHLHMLIANTN